MIIEGKEEYYIIKVSDEGYYYMKNQHSKQDYSRENHQSKKFLKKRTNTSTLPSDSNQKR
jgi:hypothetical protein